jgi:hypothetical protein
MGRSADAGARRRLPPVSIVRCRAPISALAKGTGMDPTNAAVLDLAPWEAEFDVSVDMADPTMPSGNGIAHAAIVELDEEEAAAELLAPVTPIVPLPPIALAKRRVHGRYRSAGSGFQLELRVDVDGVRPTKRVSGDFFQTSGATTTYFGSFIVNAPTISVTPTQVRVEGQGSFTWSAAAPLVRVTIPRVSIAAPAKPATVQFLTPPNTAGASYLCTFASPYFRTIQWEQDSVTGAVPFVSYDTGSLPQPAGSPARVLSVPKAFAEAGIELQVSGAANVISPGPVGATWSDSELHNAMVNHFSLFANRPQWRTWLLVASRHDIATVRGIMFDYSDTFQRQGCAVFYNAIQGNDAASQRAQLRTYVHELGHAFNLLHSWEKHLANPPQPLGPNGGLGDLSWMNYDWKYTPTSGPGGVAAYWSAFPFHFSMNELVHLRHGFYRNVIMGGNPFGKGAAEVDPYLIDEPIENNSGLALELRVEDGLGRPRDFAYGEPVVIELKLSTTDLRGRTTHGYLHPNDNFVTLLIQQPSGRTVQYRPLLIRCNDEDRVVRLDADRPAIYESAYVGFGKDGFYFQEPGEYAVRAEYVATDGSRVVSPVLRFRVRRPLTAEDANAGELLMGEAQGIQLYLLGSDAAKLKPGDEALDLLLDKHGGHSLAVYANMLKGINAERDFKDVTPDKALEVRPAKPKESVDRLSAVVKASTKAGGVDNVTLNMVMRQLASAQAKAGDLDKAEQTMDRMVDVFAGKNLNPHVMDTIAQQAAATKAALAAEAK